MITLCLGDVHWSASARDAYRHDFVERLLPLIRAKRVDHVVLLGDLTTEKDRHEAALVNRIVDHLTDIAQLALLDVVCGNHDRAGAGQPFFEFVNQIENIRWWTAPAALEPHDTRGLGRVLFLPHSHDWERDWPLEDVARGGHNYIFAHATFSGAKNEAGRALSGIPTSIFAPGARVIAGDVHVPQRVGPVLYCGAPYRINFGDSFEPRVLLLRGDKATSVPVGGPRKVLIDTVTDDDMDRDDVVRPGDMVKVRVHLAPGEYARWNGIRDMWRAWADEQRVTLVQVKPVADRQEVRGSAPRRAEVVPDEQVLMAYGRAKAVDAPTMAVGQEIAREV